VPVFLVGAGPGDPDLLTLKAYRILQSCDVVIYDRLVSDAVLAVIPDAVERIFVGKEKDRHLLPQAEINQLLIAQARLGKQVARLKGGDPFIFGRGGEEMLALREAGIPVTVIPGITSASGCAASIGIPLTHRELADSVQFITGHSRQDGTLEIDWPRIATPRTTLVFYMGLSHLAAICTALTQHGLSPDTPACIIQEGTRPGERVCTGTLATLPGLAVEQALTPPALLVVGSVVGLRE
jgi:uroporphyrin-III C-methyltransferase/precorrin-2 dehydrogenase/sirohydrochlorin ferrochelatase